MKQRQLGTNGPMVSAIGLGCLSFGGIFGATNEAASREALDAAWAAGITFYDTANVYGSGVSETVLGTWLANRGHDAVLATKVGIDAGPPRGFNNTESYIRAELEASLRRLKRDHVALYYIHRRQQDIPVEEVAGTMSRLVEEGKIGGYGLSEVAPHTIRRAHAVHPVRAVQNEYSLWTRLPELGVIRACADLGVAFVPFSPVARGMLTDSWPDPAQMTGGDIRMTIPRFVEPNFSANKAQIEPFRAFAASKGLTTAALALAWVLDRGAHLIPIPGTRTAAHLAEWDGADRIALTQDDKATIDRLLPPGFAHGDRYDAGQNIGPERYA
jgi:aryl-alcohol dehydrogenase-like predicted oxidoreductase